MSVDKNAVPWELPRFGNWVAVGRLNQMVRKSLGDALSEQGMDLPSYDVLSTIFRFPGLKQTELAEKLLVGRSNLSMLLPDMETQGLLRRDPDEFDKRVRRVYLSSAGEKQAKKGVKIQVLLIEHMMGSISEAECDAIGESARKVINYLEDHPFEL
jgi:DNA-binding MarR family transcriptional regulator